MSNSLDFLFNEDVPETSASLPESEGFTQGNIGPWVHQVMWYTNDGIVQDDSAIKAFVDLMDDKPDYVGKKGYGTSYYFAFNRQKEAKKLHDDMGKEYSPRLTWNWRIRSSDIMNWTHPDRTAEDVFGEYLDVDCDIPTTYGNDYNRHEFHMYVLPSFVQATVSMMMADERWDNKFMADGIEWPIFDYDSLGNISTDALDKEFAKAGKPMHDIPEGLLQIQEQWVGTDGKNYQDSKLWDIRRQMWNAIKEENDAAYKNDQGSKYVAKSMLLRNALAMMEKTMIPDGDGKCHPFEGFYYRVNTRVPNLRAGAVSRWYEEKPSSGSRISHFVISEMFATKAEAEQSFSKESTSKDSSLPDLPADWQGAGHEAFIEWAKDYLSDKKLLDKPWALVEKQLDKKDLVDTGLCTVSDIQTWWEEITK